MLNHHLSQAHLWAAVSTTQPGNLGPCLAVAVIFELIRSLQLCKQIGLSPLSVVAPMLVEQTHHLRGSSWAKALLGWFSCHVIFALVERPSGCSLTLVIVISIVLLVTCSSWAAQRDPVLLGLYASRPGPGDHVAHSGPTHPAEPSSRRYRTPSDVRSELCHVVALSPSCVHYR